MCKTLQVSCLVSCSKTRWTQSVHGPGTDVRPHQRLLLGTLYARGQDHSHPLVRAALPLNIDVLETVLMHLAASRALPGHNKLADPHATRPQKRARFQGH